MPRKKNDSLLTKSSRVSRADSFFDCFYLVCSWVLPRHGRDLATVLSPFEPGGRDIQGRRVLEMILIRKVAA